MVKQRLLLSGCKQMAPWQRIGERFILGFKGQELPQWLGEFATRYGLGGVVLFDYDASAKRYGNNITSPEQVVQLTAQLAQLPAKPLLAVDQEGGRVRRLKEALGFAPLPSARVFHDLPRTEQRRLAEAAYRELRRLGFQWNLAPVVDLNLDPASPDIGKPGRAFSALPEEVEASVSVLDAAARRAGLALCLKHYPGLGGATADSHRALTDLTGRVPAAQLSLFHRLGQWVNGEAIMLSHGLVRTWDEQYPVSLSPVAVQRLRRELPQVLLLTDDLQMEGVRKSFDLETTCRCALRAGVDLLLIGNSLRDEQQELLGLVERLTQHIRGEATLLAQHQESLARIENRKARFLT